VPPNHKAIISSFLGGYVKSCGLQVGEEVKKGQTLLVLENPLYVDIQKEYIQIAQQIKYLKSEFERQKLLHEEKISSEKNFFKAESDYLQAQGMLRTLEEKLRLLHIEPKAVLQGKITSQIAVKAAISGTLSVVNAAVGSFKTDAETIIEIINTEALQLQMNVFEQDIIKIKKGQILYFTVSNDASKTFQSKVDLVGKSIQNQERSVQVFANLDASLKENFIAGMFVEAKIVTSQKTGFSLPKDAIWMESDKAYLLVLQNSVKKYQFRKTKVNLGVQTENKVEILPQANLNQQTKILVKGVFEMK
jgi:cobalt-zinc-cadmium efflux system membrane fusion protein